jgi:poly(A) polymerase
LIAIGFTPGPIFTEILKHIEEAQLGGELGSREEALAWVEKNYSRGAH